MALQDALDFIRLLRTDPALAEELRDTGDADDLGPAVLLGTRLGLTFSAQELQEAHSHDWAMRWSARVGRRHS